MYIHLFICIELPHPLSFAAVEFAQILLNELDFPSRIFILELVPHTHVVDHKCVAKSGLSCPQHQRWYGGGMQVPSSLECSS